MSNTKNDRNYYMIRMNSNRATHEEFIEYAKENNVVAVGAWGVDLSNKSSVEEAKNERKEMYPENYKQNNSFTIVAKIFVKIQEGDIILTPYRSEVMVSEVVKNKDGKIKLYNNSEEEKNLWLTSQIPVKILGFFPRTLFQTNVQTYLKNRNTAGDMTDFRENIEEVIKNGSKSLNEKIQKATNEANENLRQHLKASIGPDSNLKAGGKGFEDLLLGILKAQGLQDVEKAKIIQDSIADVDIEAKAFTLAKDRYIRYYIQAKHHTGTENDWGIKQLVEHPDDDDALATVKILITTADEITKEAFEHSERDNIEVITRADLIDNMIMPNLTELDNDILQGLNLVKLDNGVISIMNSSKK